MTEKAKEKKTMFETLAGVNVNGHTEKKNGLTYLSWAWAWDEFCRHYPDATYSVYKAENGLPYVYDPNTGYMVYVEVTAGGKTHEMWLPVMDSGNNAMKAEAYSFKTKWGKQVNVAAATMFDVNKTIMRALVKCLAMFGLGLYIYAGEDIPQTDEQETQQQNPQPVQDMEYINKLFDENEFIQNATKENLLERVHAAMDLKGITEAEILAISKQGAESLEAMEKQQLGKLLGWLGRQ